MPKKAIGSKRPRGSSSLNTTGLGFISADVEARFHDSLTRCSRIKERGFDIDVENARVEDFQRFI